MPRISPRTLRQAHAINPLLASLLPTCKDILSAQNELRWLAQHALAQRPLHPPKHRDGLVKSYVRRRAQGEPLQYILGSEYFADLEIICRPGVLIPRQETAASVTHLVQRLKPLSEHEAELHVLDLCTGTGCIPLLFHHEFYSRRPYTDTRLQTVGVDISSTALNLCRENLEAQYKAQSQEHTIDSVRHMSLSRMMFVEADVLARDTGRHINGPKPIAEVLRELHGHDQRPKYDILISNPPYISSRSFRTTTSRSVRNHEPKLALVPQTDHAVDSSSNGDVFYPHLLQLARQVEAKAVLLEVADLQQAERVAAMCVHANLWVVVEIWKDDPSERPDESQEINISGTPVMVRGTGNGRSVFAYRKSATSWFES